MEENADFEATEKKHYVPKPPPPPPPKESAAQEAAAGENYLWERRFELQHRVLANLLYQQQRRHILDGRDKLAKLAALLASSIIFAQLAPLVDYFSVFAAIACAGGLAALVFGFAERAQDATNRQAQWAELNQQIESLHWREVNTDILARWFAKACAIEASEPAPNAAVLETCAARATLVLNPQGANNKSGKPLWSWPASLRPIP